MNAIASTVVAKNLSPTALKQARRFQGCAAGRKIFRPYFFLGRSVTN
jgi:hypothetical protein